MNTAIRDTANSVINHIRSVRTLPTRRDAIKLLVAAGELKVATRTAPLSYNQYRRMNAVYQTAYQLAKSILEQ